MRADKANSIGRWEGQTLVIDTVAASSATNYGSDIFSDQARYTERIRQVSEDTLEDQITIEDSIALSHRWRIVSHYHRIPNMNRLFDEVCGETERNPVVNGKFTLTPPKP